MGHHGLAHGRLRHNGAAAQIVPERKPAGDAHNVHSNRQVLVLVALDHRIREELFAHLANFGFRHTLCYIEIDDLALTHGFDSIKSHSPQHVTHRFTLMIEAPILQHRMHMCFIA